MVHTIKQQQALTQFGFLVIFFGILFPFQYEEAALSFTHSPSVLVPMNVEMLTPAIEEDDGRGPA